MRPHNYDKEHREKHHWISSKSETITSFSVFADLNKAVKHVSYFIIHLHPWACVATYKSWAVVTEGGFHVSGLCEVVDKPETQFGADDTGPHEIRCDLLSADEALPGQP